MVGDSLNQSIAASDSGKMHVGCIASSPGAYSSTLLLHCSDGVLTFDTSILVSSVQTGKSVPLQLRLSDLDNAHAGDTISVPISIYGGNGESFNGFDLDLRYNSDLLEMLPPVIANTNSSMTYGAQYHRLLTGGTLSIEGPLTTDPRLPLIILRFATQLTDTNCTTISIAGCSFSDTSQNTLCPQSTALDSAQICVQPLCGDNELQALLRGKTNGILSLTVLGEDHSMLVSYASTTTPLFSLIDEVGRRFQPSSVQYISRTKSHVILGAIPNGFYTLLMEDGSQSYSRGFVYVK